IEMETPKFSLQDHLRLVQNQYNEGLVSYLEVNQAIQQVIPVQQSQVDLQASYLLDKLSLYQALGGGY
ncbi:MAG: TolC family protein, partial [Cyanobacteria bacterium]|nr:TolC family protein [Cyanobacteriota bacterium]